MEKHVIYSGVFIKDALSVDQARKRYTHRRQKIAQSTEIPLLIYGVESPPFHQFPWAMSTLKVFQDPLFLYLTGINQPKAALFLDAAHDIEWIFLPNYDANKVFWEGASLSIGCKDHNKLMADFFKPAKLFSINEILPRICAHIGQEKTPKLGMAWQGSAPTQEQAVIRTLVEKETSKPTFINIANKAWQTRLCLDKTDQENARHANYVSEIGFKTILAHLLQHETETSLSGHLIGELLKGSSHGLSFAPIVASGPNACTLHYTKNDSKLNPKHLILLDFGVRTHSMVSDISRTVPLSGKFNPLQRCLYELVLTTQKAVEAACKPGVSIETLNTLCWETLETLLEENFLKKGGHMNRPYDKAPHFVSHLIGQAVHDGDPYRQYRFLPLQPGMLISNEPGLYGEFEITIKEVHYKEFIGIRIEDNLLITPSGIENISQNIPKEIPILESLIFKKYG